VNRDGKNDKIPVINTLGNIDVVVKYGGLTKIVVFVPSEETESSTQWLNTRPKNQC
jgi:hypothetical protein